VMSSQPDKNWAAAPGARPFSMTPYR